MLDEHPDRPYASAKAPAFTHVPSREETRKAIFETLKANDMRDVHIRLTPSRGLNKITSGMDPWSNYFALSIVLAEWKPSVYDQTGIRLVTSSIRRTWPMMLDSKIHHNNLLNNILAKIEATLGVDDALMLDLHGFGS